MELLGHFFGFLEQFSWIGSVTNMVHLENTLDVQVAEIGKAIAMDLTLTKVLFAYPIRVILITYLHDIQYTLALFAVFPLAGIIRLLPSTSLKHLYSLLLGLFLVQWIFGADWGHFFVSSAVTYILCIVVPKKYVHIVVFVWAMGYMTMAHVYRMYVSYMSGIFDFTGTQVSIRCGAYTPLA